MEKSGISESSFEDILRSRRSIRQFLPEEVSREKLERILHLSLTAPSWKNARAYKILLVSGSKKEELSRALLENGNREIAETPDFPFQENYPSYIKKRMLELGAGYYNHLGVDRKDRERRKELLLDNFRFFGAPHVILLLLEEGMGYWPALDLGIFLGTLMLTIRSEGLDSIAQASLAGYPDTVRNVLGLEPNWKIAVGLSLGYADREARTNTYSSPSPKWEEMVDFMD